ncbi:MAG: hypothetical protein C4576_20830 [Desulfobacteraceae bacterium]|nr:MAG: hypothetical protein C4576_20830 [Desulfobacteraceae bacterium]
MNRNSVPISRSLHIHYLFSSPQGDVSVDKDLLARPFLLSPMSEHPTLRLGDYFEAIEQFIVQDEAKPLLRLLGRNRKSPVQIEGIAEILIRSEKHGGLYHLASVEVRGPGMQEKFVVSTAVSERSREWLTREFGILKTLHESFALPYVPEVYWLGEEDRKEDENPFLMMLGEWFEDYHEWHLHKNASGEPYPVIWDFAKGYRRAEEGEAFEIYRQASFILTLYYDLKSTNHIYPWLHAAGDFIVKSEYGLVQVRLTTVRGYEPFIIFQSHEDTNPVSALICFFLNLTIRMRLDRWEGVGGIAWAADPCIRPTVEGFFQALHKMEVEGRYELGKVRDLLSLLKRFQPEELLSLATPLLDLYRAEDREALAVVEENLGNHCRSLFSVVQDLP